MAGVYEQYGTTSGFTTPQVDLYWYITVPPGAQQGQTFPFVVGWHPGGYKSGSSALNHQAQAFAEAGFVFVGCEYRLAPPSIAMNTVDGDNGFTPGDHPSPGQDTANDEGHYPSQTTDCRMAVRAARAHELCNGTVFAVGGSAGASHAMFLLATGTNGDDAPDAVAALSIGVANLADDNIWAMDCDPQDHVTCPHEAIANYLDITDTNPNPLSGADLTLAQAASPALQLRSNMNGMFIFLCEKDSLGIPTSTGVDATSYDKDSNVILVETDTENGMIPNLIAEGYTESSSDVPVAGTYKFELVPSDTHAHAFNYWEHTLSDGSGRTVGEAIIEFFNGVAVGEADPPTITGFEPTEIVAGLTEVVITGTNFSGAEGVRFNHVDALSFIVDSDTQITAVPPLDATDGRIQVRTPVDTINSDDEYTVVVLAEDTTPELPERTPILDYPVGGLPPVPPMRPSVPLSVQVVTNGVAGNHDATLSWLPPEDDSGATLLNYIVSCVGENGESATIPDIEGNDVTAIIEDLEADTLFTLTMQAQTIFGISDPVVVQFTSNPPHSGDELKAEPRGCLCLFQTPNHVIEFRPAEVPNFWNNAHLAGSRFRTGWDIIQPNPTDPTEFFWDDIDEYLGYCETYGKIAGISIASGIYTAPWVFQDGKILRMDVTSPETGTMPIPWQTRYLDYWIGGKHDGAQFEGLLRTFAERYDNRPELSYVVLGGLGQIIETILAVSENDLATLLVHANNAGFASVREAWEYAAQRILQAASRAFRNTWVFLSLAKPVPNSVNNGDGDVALTDIVQFGLDNIPNFGIMNAGLNAASDGSNDTAFMPFRLIYTYSSRLSVGFQYGHDSSDPRCDPTQDPDSYDQETGFINTNEAGATTNKAKFLELYVPDATETTGEYVNYPDLIDDATALLAANPDAT